MERNGPRIYILLGFEPDFKKTGVMERIRTRASIRLRIEPGFEKLGVWEKLGPDYSTD